MSILTSSFDSALVLKTREMGFSKTSTMVVFHLVVVAMVAFCLADEGR